MLATLMLDLPPRSKYVPVGVPVMEGPSLVCHNQ